MIKKKNNGIAALIICLCLLITGCGEGKTEQSGLFKEKKPFDSFGDGEPFTAEVHTPEERVQENQAFISKLSFEEGFGDFKLTPVKYGDSAEDFWLIVENENDYPAAAYVTFVMKDEAGEVIRAADNRTRVLKPGSRDIIAGNLTGGNGDFAKIVITASLRNGEKEGIYETIDEADIKEVGNSATGRGRRLDLEYNVPHGWIAKDVAVFYDSDGNVLKVKPFSTTGETGIYACCYTELYEYASFEIFAWVSDGEAEGISSEVLSDYKEAGYVNELDMDYESLDGNVSYRFGESADGKILIFAKNTTDTVRTMRLDEFLIYGEESVKDERQDREYRWNVTEGHEEKAGVGIGEESAVNVRELYLKPLEEIIWDTGISAGEDFYLFPSAADNAELPSPEPALSLVETDSGKLQIILDWEPESPEDVLQGTVLVVYRTDDKIVHTEAIQIAGEDNYFSHYETETEYSGDYEQAETYLQYYYLTVPIPGV